MDAWLWETLFQPWIRNFQNQDEWWCPAPAVETLSTSEISNKDGNRNLWKTLKAFFSRVINLLLTKLARDRTGRISALGLFCTDLAALGPYCQDLGPIFSQYGPRAWLIRYIYNRTTPNRIVSISITCWGKVVHSRFAKFCRLVLKSIRGVALLQFMRFMSECVENHKWVPKNRILAYTTQTTL